MKKNPYQALFDLSTEAALLGSINHMLSWDHETYMPEEALAHRSLQFERLAALVHKEKTSKKFATALGKLIDIKTGHVLDPSLTAAQKAALREWRRDYQNEFKLPTAFVKRFALVTSEASHVWKEAKQKNDFAIFLPHLKKVVDLCRKKADIMGYQDHPYDALLDSHEPEAKTTQIAELFSKLKIPLVTLLSSIKTKPKPPTAFLNHPFDHDKQLKAAQLILKAMGFDKHFSRLDEAAHPMCIGVYPSDIRMTTRIHSHDPLPNLLSVLHEGGHGLYARNLPKEEFGSPLGEPVSLGIHESQSRTWETIVGRGLPFWKFFLPKLQEIFPEQLRQVSLDAMYRAVNLVEPSFIRTESDEVTYNLHIMVRFELEKALIEGSLSVKQIPEAWNEKMQAYFGITPKDDAEGCLQDIHWSLGAIGYFPTYTLGNLYAAQFFETFKKAHPQWQEKIAAGNFSELREWLASHIHRYGRQYLPEELCQKVTGHKLSHEPFIHYLQDKYKPLYHLS